MNHEIIGDIPGLERYNADICSSATEREFANAFCLLSILMLLTRRRLFIKNANISEKIRRHNKRCEAENSIRIQAKADDEPQQEKVKKKTTSPYENLEGMIRVQRQHGSVKLNEIQK
ncbi:hypothetical protein CBL_09547 [Carabus blaptoides fortunei]